MNVEGIIYIIVSAIAFGFFLIGAIGMVSLFYCKKKNIEMDLGSLYRNLKGEYFDLGLESHETILIFILLIIGVIWFLCISDTFRIPLFFTILGFIQLTLVIYIMNRMKLNKVEVK